MKSLLPSREQMPAIVTVIAVILLASGYYFVYLPNNEKNIIEWKFRSLRNVDRNIHTKIRNGYSLLEVYVLPPDFKDLLKKWNDKKKDSSSIVKAIEDFRIKQNNKITGQKERIKKIGNLGDQDFEISTIDSDKSGILEEQKKCIIKNKKLTLTRIDTVSKKAGVSLLISQNYDFKKFIIPILPEDVFDEYLIIGNNSVLYETFTSGLDHSDDSLIVNSARYTGSLSIGNKYFAGIEYKLFIQPVVCDSYRILVIGLTTNENFQAEKTKLPFSVILLLITVFAAIIISFPILKLYQLGNDDRLTIGDGIFSTLVGMLLMSILFFTFFKYTSQLSIPSGKQNPKKILADKLSTAFITEVDSNRRRLARLANLARSIPSSRLNISLPDINYVSPKDINLLKQRGPDSIAGAIRSNLHDVNLDRVFWLDSDGNEKYAWKAEAFSDTSKFFLGNFADRTYFKKVRENQAFGVDSSKYYLDQVISWIDGKFITLISIPFDIDTVKVPVLSFYISSLKDTKLPLGYTFIVINKEGKVLYHSKEKKNLTENLREEFSNGEEVLKAIRTNSEHNFTTDYFGHEYDAFIKPISDEIPYHIVILDDKSFLESRDLDIYSFTFSMQFLLFGFLIIEMLAVFFVSAKRSVYQDQIFDTSWLGPKELSHDEYILATVFNLWVFSVLFLSHYFTPPLCNLFIILSGISSMPLFLNCLYRRKYTEDITKKRYKNRTIIVLTVIILLTNLIGLIQLSDSLYLLDIFDILFLLPVIVILYFKRSDNSYFLNKIKTETNYRQSFTALVFSWTLVACGLPVLIFYVTSYNYNQHLIARSKQFYLAENLVKTQKQKAGKIKGTIPEDTLRRSFYEDQYWCLSSNDTTFKPSPVSNYEGNTATTNLLNAFQFIENDDIANRRIFKTESVADTTLFFNNLLDQTTAWSDSTVTYFKKPKFKNQVVITSASLNFSFPSLIRLGGLLCWLTLIAALAGMFLLFQSVIKKLFSLDIPDVSTWKILDEEIMSRNVYQNMLFVTSLSPTDAKTYIGSKFKNSSNLEIDLREISLTKKSETLSEKWDDLTENKGKGKYSLLVISHFEHDFKNPEANNKKLQILEDLVLRAKKINLPTVIISAIQLSTFLTEITESDTKSKAFQNKEKWIELLSNFYFLIHPLSRSSATAKPSLINEEIQSTQFYDNIASPASEASQKIVGIMAEEEKQESVIFRLQNTSYHFYTAIWQWLSKEEKFLLYDLAEDGLVNDFNKNTVCLLLAKGVIVRNEGRLRLFNKGFRHFILTGIESEETMQIMKKINDNKNWNKIKIPLALISLTILGFLLSSQHETSVQLLTVLGALAGAIPALISFLSSLGSGTNANDK